MCARFSLVAPPEVVAEIFDLEDVLDFPPRYNVAPTQAVPVVRADPERGRRLDLLRWGLVPWWARDLKIGARMINARSETAAEKPAFRDAVRMRRCIVPVDGFYEWQKLASGKQPMRIRRRDRRPFAFAGLWERWRKGDAEPVESFTVLTTEPNDLLRPIHDRMPVILAPEDFDRWLDPALRSPDAVSGLLAPCEDDELEAYPVSTLVNSWRNDVPACIEPVG